MTVNGRLVLTKEERTQNYWIPGGKLKEGKSPKQAALRELQEESGITEAMLSSCVKPMEEIGKFFAWDTAPPMISFRKLDSLLKLITDPTFNVRRLVGLTAKKLRGLKSKLPLLPTRQVRSMKTVTHKVTYNCI